MQILTTNAPLIKEIWPPTDGHGVFKFRKPNRWHYLELYRVTFHTKIKITNRAVNRESVIARFRQWEFEVEVLRPQRDITFSSMGI